MKRIGWLATAVCLMSIVGCGDQGSSKPTAQVNGQPAAAGSATAALEGPAEAVRQFLEAVRLGQDDQAGNMLTKVARQKTAELDMVVAPPGSDTASYSVGKIAKVGDDGAHVESSWTDIDADGNPRTDYITWIVRKEGSEWRIAGMATKVFTDQDAVVLNFEDPEDMLRQQKAAEEEAVRRANAEKQEARQPQDPFKK